MQNLSLAGQFEMLRAHLESALPTPAIFVVSSARADDGKGLVARGLADSFAGAGYRTLLVHADAAVLPLAAAAGPQKLSDLAEAGVQRYSYKSSETGSDCIVLSSDECRRSASHESVAMVCTSFRSKYSYTIVDAATISENNLALLFAMAVDGVLLTVREGRRVTSADRELNLALKRSDIPLLGVVSIDSGTISADSTAAAKPTAGYPRVAGGAQLEKKQERQPV